MADNARAIEAAEASQLMTYSWPGRGSRAVRLHQGNGGGPRRSLSNAQGRRLRAARSGQTPQQWCRSRPAAELTAAGAGFESA